jgi:hypothetical protein
MSRIKKLETHYQERLKEKDIKNISEFIKSILDSDITKGKYARFLIESFLNDKFLEEDLMGGLDSTVGQTISLFDKHKNKLPVEQRSVYALNKETGEVLYQSPGDLWNIVKQFQENLSGHELKREQKNKIYDETKLYYEDEKTGLKVVNPLTEESAKWWGKGTRWCTSADKNNQFEYYNTIAPLLILLMPNGEKLQLWRNGNEVQFMDEADNDVSKKYIKDNMNVLLPFFKDNYFLNYLKDKTFNDDYYYLSLKKDGANLAYIPSKLITRDIILDVINNLNEKNGFFNEIFTYIPFKLFDIDMFKKMLMKKNDIFSLLPDSFKSNEINTMMVKKDGLNLGLIPPYQKNNNKKLCELAIEQNGGSLYAVPLAMKSKELCLKAVYNNAQCISYIPEEIIDNEIIDECLKQKVCFLRHVPEKLKTVEMCKLAIKNNEIDISHIINSKYLIDSVIEYAKNNLDSKQMLNNIPYFYHNKVSMALINEDSKMYNKLPDSFRTKEISEYIFKKDKNMFPYIPHYYQTKKMCDDAVRFNIDFFKDTQKIYRDIDICWYVLKKDIQLIKYVPNNIKSKLFCPDFYKILIDNINNNMKNMYYMPKNICIDENFLPFIEQIKDTKIKNNIMQRFISIHKNESSILKM